MPKYNAIGIEARLSVASLQASCSNIIDLRMGVEQKQDAERIENVFASGRNLPEQPIGADGDAKGVLQFVGAHEDLPLFVVEAGDRLACDGLYKEEEGAEDVLQAKGGPVQDVGTDSPLTSLNGTPSLGEGTPTTRESPGPSAPTATRKRAKKGQVPSPAAGLTSFSSFERARGFLDSPDGPQALCLTVQTSLKSFLPKAGSSRRDKDLKMEVFLNGEMVGQALLNPRGSAVELKDDRVVFHGTRVHRQSERAWTYTATAAADGGSSNAEKRWQATARALEDEANARGRNKWGDCPPSAELLSALSRLELPERLRGKHGLAVFDLVITSGTGKKYGPDTAYLTAPTRMHDPAYKVVALDDPFNDAEMLFGTAVREPSPSPLRPMSLAPPVFGLTQSSPEIPLMRQRRSMTAEVAPATPSPSKKQRLREKLPEFEIEGLDLNKTVASFENARGKTGQSRTLRQRLNDIAQMNATNRAKAIAALQVELDEDTRRAVMKDARKRREAEMMPSPSKKARHEPFVAPVAEMTGFKGALMMLADAALAAGDGSFGVDPAMLYWQSTPVPVLRPHGMQPYGDLDAMLLDGAQDEPTPVDPNGLDLIPAPQLTPQKKTRASALANSPCSVPVKVSARSKTKNTPTPQRGSPSVYYPRIGSPIPIDPILHPNSNHNSPVNGKASSVSPPKSGAGANRTRNRWNPGEKTALQALEAFGTDGCEGSVVGYAPVEIDGKKVQRQVGKARGGEFREESVVVGMRWVVV